MAETMKLRDLKITEEDIARMKQERVDYKKNLTLEFQLGYYVGSKIFTRYLPTLSTDSLQSRNVIQVSSEDLTENKRLNDEWFDTTRYGKNRDENSPNGNKEKWNLYYEHNKMLEKKYLPDPLVCHLRLLNVEKWDRFKEGLIDYLWDCDMCSYSLEADDIEISDDEDSYFTIIKFKLP
jgi:hypothetical protein